MKYTCIYNNIVLTETALAAVAQLTGSLIQQQINAMLPSGSAITSQFAKAPSTAPALSDMAPIMAFSPPDAESATPSAMASSLAQPTIDSIMQEITAMLPSGLASAITPQFAGASTTPGQADMPLQLSDDGAASIASPSDRSTPSCRSRE